MSDKRAQTVKTLLDAEEQAKAMIEAARSERDMRLKQAATEADAQIAKYKSDKEAEYQGEVSKYDSSSGTESTQIKADADRNIKSVTVAAGVNKPKVCLLFVQMRGASLCSGLLTLCIYDSFFFIQIVGMLFNFVTSVDTSS